MNERETRRLNRRKLFAQVNLSDAIPSESDLTDEAARQNFGKNLMTFTSEFEDLYTHLLNNVRVNLPNTMKPIYKSLDTFSSIAEMSQEDMSKNPQTVIREMKNAIVALKNSASATKRIMHTIVQECNDIIKSMSV